MTRRARPDDPLEPVHAAIARAAPDARLLGPAAWDLPPINGRPVGVRARVAGGEWLELTAPLAGTGLEGPGTAWRLLSLNAHLRDATRVAARCDGGLVLRADLACAGEDPRFDRPAVDGADLADRVRQLRVQFDAILDHCQRWIGEPGGSDVRPPDVAAGRVHVEQRPERAAAADGDATGRLVELCAEGGWAATPRAPGLVTVTLETRHAAYSARLSLRPEDGFQAVVFPGDAAPASAVSRVAIARLLLRLSAAVRFVKGVVVPVPDGDGVRHGIAAACATPRTAADMAVILSALAVACGIAGREIGVLVDQGLARDYVALTGRRFGVADGGDVTEKKEGVCLQQQ